MIYYTQTVTIEDFYEAPNWEPDPEKDCIICHSEMKKNWLTREFECPLCGERECLYDFGID